MKRPNRFYLVVLSRRKDWMGFLRVYSLLILPTIVQSFCNISSLLANLFHESTAS